MAHEILSAKLCELDRKMGRLRSRIQLSETGSREEIRQELAAIRRECAEDRGSLQDQMRFSRFRPAARIAGTFEQISGILEQAREEIQQMPEGEDKRELQPEEKILMAEYMLDFAMQMANRALLVSLEAIEGQMTEEPIEKKEANQL